MSLTQATLSGAAWIAGGSITRLFLRVVSIGILARLLTPADYGVVAATFILVDLSLIVVNFGVSEAVVQRKELGPKHIATGLTLVIFVTVVLSVVFWFLAPQFANIIKINELNDVAAWYTLVLFARGIGAFLSALLSRNFGAKQIAFTELSSWFISVYFFAIPLAYMGFSYWALVWANVVEALLGMVIFLVFCRKYLVRPDFDFLSFKQLIFISAGFAINKPLNFLTANVDRFLIVRFLGAADLGVYSRAAFLVKTATTMFGNLIRIAVFPNLSRIQDDHARLEDAVLKGVALIALLTLPTGVFLALFSQEIIVIMLGSKWQSAVAPFTLFALTFYFGFAQRNFAVLFDSTGRPHVMLPIRIVYLLLLIAGIFKAIDHGLQAVVYAISAALVVFYLLTLGCAVVIGKINLRRVVSVHLGPILFTKLVLFVALPVKAMSLDVNPAIILVLATIITSVCVGTVLYFRPTLLMDKKIYQLITDSFLEKVKRR